MFSFKTRVSFSFSSPCRYQQTYFQFMLKRYLETSCDTHAAAAAAFDRLKQARKLVRRLKTSFENTVLNINPQDMYSLNPITPTFRMGGMMKPSSECSVSNPLSDLSSLMTQQQEQKPEPKKNPFAPQSTFPCTNPSEFWKQKSSSTTSVLEQCLKNFNS